MWNLKYDTTEPIYETERGPGTSQTDGCQERGAEEGLLRCLSGGLVGSGP